MSSIDRPLSADVLHFDLAAEEKAAIHPETLERDGRSSRTLLKDGALRVTLIVLGPGGGIPEHTAQGPVTVHPLRGSLEVTVEDETHAVAPGGLLTFGAGVSHAVRSEEGAAFLLTVAHTG
ncbi:MAG: cupin domain-containing protein [Candidatus Longimicrobiales bacterium M2_2A_002]